MKETAKWFGAGFVVGAMAPAVLLSSDLSVGKGAAVLSNKTPEAHILFVGDMFFDRHIRVVMERRGEEHVFSCINDFLLKADVVVGNLEGPVTNYPSRSRGSVVGSPENFVFTFPSSVASLLFRHNVKIVNLGNNHIGNMGLEGILQTHRALFDAGVAYFGGIAGQEYVYRTEIHTVPLTFVNYNEFGGALAAEVAEKIRYEYESGRVVVLYAHWGEEYIDSSARLRPIAELFARNGAVLIVGSHPHVVLGSEKIGDTPVYYSLGNFIFDQYFDEAVMRGLALKVVFTRNGAEEIVEYPVALGHDGRTCLASQ